MKKVMTTIGGFVIAFFGGFDVKNAMIAMLSFFLWWCCYEESNGSLLPFAFF